MPISIKFWLIKQVILRSLNDIHNTPMKFWQNIEIKSKVLCYSPITNKFRQSVEIVIRFFNDIWKIQIKCWLKFKSKNIELAEKRLKKSRDLNDNNFISTIVWYTTLWYSRVPCNVLRNSKNYRYTNWNCVSTVEMIINPSICIFLFHITYSLFCATPPRLSIYAIPVSHFIVRSR